MLPDFTVSEIAVGDFAGAWIFLCVNFSPCPNRCDLSLLVAVSNVYICRLQRRALQGLNFYIATPNRISDLSLIRMSSSSVKRSGRRGGKLKRAREEQRKQEEDLDALSCGEIRKRLLDLGESPGPIDTSNK